jgi:NTE family protein
VTSSPTTNHVRPAHRPVVLVVTVLGIFMTFLDATIVNVAFPAIQTGFGGAHLADLSWILNAYNAVIAAVLLPAGGLADLLGRRRVFLFGLAVFVVGSLLCSIAPSVAVLIAARVVQAVGAGLIVPASLALLLSAFPPERRATAVGLWGAAAAVAAAIGPTLGGLLVESSSWRTVFVVNLPIGAAAWIAGRRVLTEQGDRAAGRLPDVVGLVCTAGAMGLLALGIVKGNDWGWGDVRVAGAFATSIGLAALAALRSRGRATAAVVRDPAAVVANIGTLVFAGGFYAMLLCNVLYLTQIWHYSTLVAGLALTPTAVLAAAAAGPAGRIADRFGHAWVIVPGSIALAAAGAMFTLRVGTSPSYLAEWLPATVVSGLGIGLAFPALSAAAVAALPEPQFAKGSAINASARQLGALLGVAILVAILGSASSDIEAGSFDGGWTFVTFAGLVTVLLVLLRTGLGRAGVVGQKATEVSVRG